MQALLEAIRDACPKPVWQRATALAQTATVTGKRTADQDLELRVVTRGGMTSPRVWLSPGKLDWSCECDSGDDACIHVAASAQWMAQAQERGQDLSAFTAPTIKIAYRLSREDD